MPIAVVLLAAAGIGLAAKKVAADCRTNEETGRMAKECKGGKAKAKPAAKGKGKSLPKR